MNDLYKKTEGCLIGGAVGDALGYPVEFIGYQTILHRYGAPGIRRYDCDAALAQISDDTQMTIMTAMALAETVGTPWNLPLQLSDISDAYLAWYSVQRWEPLSVNEGAARFLPTAELPFMRANRAPGNTCLSALRSIMEGQPVKNNSKGCGGIMRIAPVATFGVLHGQSDKEIVTLAGEAARLTHRHPMGYLPAAIMAFILARCLRADAVAVSDIKAWISESKTILSDYAASVGGASWVDELINRSLYAVSLAEGDKADIDCIDILGEGWTGDEAWDIALFCACRHIDSFENAVVAAVNHSGDSDSTGAIAGNIMGAIHGIDAIPAYYRENLEASELLTKLSKI